MRHSVHIGLPAIALFFATSCASLVNPSPDEVRALVVAEIAKTGTSTKSAAANKPDAFGSLTIVKKSQTADAVVIAYEVPAGPRLYLGEVVYRRQGLKYVPTQVTAEPKKFSITLDFPDAARSVWKASNGAYRLFAHKDAPAISHFSQLSQRPLMLAFVDEQMKPIPWPIQGFSGPADPAVKGMKITVMQGSVMGLFGDVPPILTSVAKLFAAGAAKPAILFQNDKEQYRQAFLEKKEAVVVMSAAAAKIYGFDEYSELTELLIK